MPAVCPSCGAYAVDARCCGECGAPTPWPGLPLFVVTGASGVGKTTVVDALYPRLPDCFVFEGDAYWDLHVHGLDVFRDVCLRTAFVAQQSGRSTVLCGTFLPEHFESLPMRHLVGDLHLLVLHCSDEAREARLRARPAWRNTADDEFIEKHKEFAALLLTRGWPVVDTTDRTVDAVADDIAGWARGILAPTEGRTL